MELRSQHVIVTGASGGLGRALCTGLIAAGARVSAIDIDESALDRMLEDDDSGRLITRVLDITDVRACAEGFASLRDEQGPVDILINNAGITHFSTVVDLACETVAQVMAVNFQGAVNCTRAVLPDLLERRGQVVVMSSVAGFAPLYGRAAYSASKHALHGFFETLRAETMERGMNVLIVCPSFIASQRDTANAGSPYPGAARPGGASETIGDVMQPETAAREILQAISQRTRDLRVGSVAKQSYWVRRLWPGLYEKIMVSRARREVGE
jgi:NAD(P)-dependent dehydrogenase (short-subunit alcohol dehydrogenase family)